MKPEEVKIEIEDDILTISGKHEQQTEEQHKNHVRHERRCGAFSRSMALTHLPPREADTTATFWLGRPLGGLIPPR